MNHTVISKDVDFDEYFLSTHVRLPSRARFSGGQPLQPHPQEVTENDQVEVTGFLPPHDQRGVYDPSDSSSESADSLSEDDFSQNSEIEDQYYFADYEDTLETQEESEPQSSPVYFDVEEVNNWNQVTTQPKNDNNSVLFDYKQFEEEVAN